MDSPELKSFQQLSSAIYKITLLWLPVIAYLWLTAYCHPSLFIVYKIGEELTSNDFERLFLLSYFSLWLITWFVYFLSDTTLINGKTKTLRTLLRHSSQEWENHSLDDDSFYKNEHKYYDEMSSKTMTAIAVMIGSSLVCLAQINTMASALEPCLSNNCDNWDHKLLILAAIFSTIAFSGFVLSIDLIDSMFTNYRTGYLKRRLQYRFFNIMVNRRYPALISLLTSTIIIAGVHNGYLGSLLVGTYLFLGRSNWFPSFPDSWQDKASEAVFISFTVIIILLSGAALSFL